MSIAHSCLSRLNNTPASMSGKPHLINMKHNLYCILYIGYFRPNNILSRSSYTGFCLSSPYNHQYLHYTSNKCSRLHNIPRRILCNQYYYSIECNDLDIQNNYLFHPNSIPDSISNNNLKHYKFNIL